MNTDRKKSDSIKNESGSSKTRSASTKTPNKQIRKTSRKSMFAFALLVPGVAMQSASAANETTLDVDILINEMSSTQTEITKLDTNDVDKIEELNEQFWAMNDLINIVTDVEPERDFIAEWKSLEEKQQVLENTLTVLEELGMSGDIDQVLNAQITQTETDIEKLRQDSIASMILDPQVQNELEKIQKRIHQEYPHIIDTTIDPEEKVEFRHKIKYAK